LGRAGGSRGLAKPGSRRRPRSADRVTGSTTLDDGTTFRVEVDGPGGDERSAALVSTRQVNASRGDIEVTATF
jgi:hypothetical protein